MNELFRAGVFLGGIVVGVSIADDLPWAVTVAAAIAAGLCSSALKWREK